MTTFLATFSIALVLSLVLTPLLGRLGARLGAIDTPDHRKQHTGAVPRTGGAAIVAVFLVTLSMVRFFGTDISNLLMVNRALVFLLAGGLVCFAVGLTDDFFPLHPAVKLLFQVLGASMAYVGGVRIGGVEIFGLALRFGPFSYLVTVFWFVLFINAVNLADGLDGLAGGVVVFASFVMIILAVLEEKYLTALLFTALAGSVLGFLRYNFNPATIFLGDGGSYFLGYAIAGLSITGLLKSQVGVAMAIPLLALGVPLFDTLLAPMRRFVRGREMFRPDHGHVHHRLLGMGLSASRAVWVIYGITLVLCLLAVMLVNVRDERAGLFLIVLGAGAVIFTRKLGYFEYIASDKVYGWFKDLSDEAGLSRGRRSFLSLQMDAAQSKTAEQLWDCVRTAARMLEFDRAELGMGASEAGSGTGEHPRQWLWQRDGLDLSAHAGANHLLKLDMPLMDEENQNLGHLRLVKDLRHASVHPFTLRRVEHLRRTVIQTLKKLRQP